MRRIGKSVISTDVRRDREAKERREIAISGRGSLIHIGQLARTSRERDKELVTGISWWKIILYDFPINDEK